VSTIRLPSSTDDLHELLSHWPVGNPASTEPIAARGHVAKLVFAARPPLVLKLTGPTADRARWNDPFQARVLAHLDARGVGVPTPIDAEDGQAFVDWRDHRYTLSRYQDSGPRPTGPDERRVLCRDVGRAIAGLHQALATYPADEVARETRTEDISRRSRGWTEELRVKIPAVHHDALDHASNDLMPEVHRALDGLPQQLIHRDLHPGNLLTSGTAAVGFLDCDHLCTGPRLLDLAYYALSLRKWAATHEHEADHWPDYLRALVDGYDETSELSEHERATVPHLMVATEVRFAVWMFDLHPESIAGELHTLTWLHDQFHQIAACTRRTDCADV
jgi:Ser/Thr protein kinase RdoA (MazF antagonist)